ncbi:hypothetical protein [Actinoplanes sp. DH11]|uniref:hypothetical protein n=1 Tax=Actinoplanes sp. DH11 TaxID=2857011 RepID=UPI001E30A771|nr:hypothetical protein [Actinoplanes sp. DH11]
MTDRLDVDVALLDAIAERLTRTGGDVDAAGAAAPAPPDAGVVTAEVAEVLALLCGGAVQLTGALRDAGGRVAEASRLYAGADAGGGSAIREVY